MDWSRLKPREKAAILALAGFMFFGIYVKMVQEPVAKKVSVYQSQIKKSQAQLADLKTKAPQDSEIADKIQVLESDENRLSEQIDTLEKKIPSRYNMAQMVGEFTRLAKEIKLESVKQKIVKDQGYSHIVLEVKFYATYLNAIKYLASVESISPFLKVEEMEILEPKGKTVELGGSPVRLTVSCLLSDNAEGGKLKASEVSDLSVKRDILASNARPADKLEESKFSLEGITFDPRNPSAIINGDVFQLNSEIGGYKVKKILADTVVLTDGIEDHLLSLKGKETELKR